MTKLDEQIAVIEEFCKTQAKINDVFYSQYQAQVSRQQHKALTSEMIMEHATAPDAVTPTDIDLSHRITQMCLFDTLFWFVPNATTSITITLGNKVIKVSNPTPSYNLPGLKLLLGGGDKIKMTFLGAAGDATFGLSGEITGSNLQI